MYIHGTNDEASIGRAASHGCVRMRNRDVIALFDQVPVGTPVWIDA
ncbi:MAG TPA: L,D-transpeptidase [Prosthecobacter sp.]